MTEKLQAQIREFENCEVPLEKIKQAIDICEHSRNQLVRDNLTHYVEFILAESEKNDFLWGEAKAYYYFSFISYQNLFLDKALEHAFKGLRIFKTLGKDKDVAKSLNNIGVYYNALGLRDKALDYYRESLTYNSENVFAINNIGECYAEKNEDDNAVQYFLKTIELASQQDQFSMLANAYKNMGEIYNKQEDVELAIECFDQSLTILKDNPDFIIETLVYIGLSESYFILKDLQQALRLSRQAYDIAIANNSAEGKWFCYKRLCRIYEALEDYQQQVHYLKHSLKLHEQMYTGKVTQRIAELEAAYELEKQELETKQIMEKNARLASIGVMAAGITHEINQPLNAVQISADSLLLWDKRNKGVIPEMFIKELNQISSGVKRIDEIVRHMRMFWVTPDVEEKFCFNLNEAIKSGLSLIEKQLQVHGIDLSLDLIPDMVNIEGNRIHIEQIIINLVTNAIHSLDETDNKEKNIRISTEIDGDKIILKVQDNGIGLLQSDIDKLFEPFYSTRKPGKGMGLGLAIVQQYIDVMNGEIVAGNNSDGGACFSIELPIMGKEN